MSAPASGIPLPLRTGDAKAAASLFVCGLTREARIARGPGAVALCGDAATLQAGLAGLARESIGLVVSFGLCGGLDPALRCGDIIVGAGVVGGSRTDAPLSRAIAARLRAAGERVACSPFPPEDARPVSAPPQGRGAPSRLDAGEDAAQGDDGALIAPVTRPIARAADKQALRVATGAAGVDMESAAAGAFAAQRGVPFVILRAVSDTIDRDLPALVMQATAPSGAIRYGAVAHGLLRAPGDLPALIAAARDSAAAFAALGRCRRLLAGFFLGLGGADFR